VSTTYRLARAKGQAQYNRNIVELGAHLSNNPSLQVSHDLIDKICSVSISKDWLTLCVQDRFAGLLCTDGNFFHIAQNNFPVLRDVDLPVSDQSINPHAVSYDR